MTRLLLSLALALALSGCLPQAEGDGRPFTGRTGPGFSLGATNDLSKAGKDGVPDLSFLQTFDLNWAEPGGTPSDSQPFYIFGADETNKVVITHIDIRGRNPEDFEIVGVTLPITLGYNEYTFFRVRFNPKAAIGDRTATVIISSDTGSVEAVRVQANSAPDKGEISIFRDGYEAFNIASLPRNAKTANAMAAPSPYEMGKCPKPFDGIVALELKNRGPGTLRINSAEITLDEKRLFILDPSVVFPLDIAPNQSQIVNLVLSPTAAVKEYAFGRIKFTSQDTNEPLYELDFGIYKPEPAPCLSVLPHAEGQPADPNVDLRNYDLGSIGAAKRVGLKLLNAGSARLTVEENTLAVGPFPGFGSACDSPTASIDLANGGGPLVLEPGDSHEAMLVITGTTNCPAQEWGRSFPAQIWITKDEPRSYPIIEMRGMFLAVGQSAVKLNYGRTKLPLYSGDSIVVPTVGVSIGMRNQGSAELKLLGFQLSSGEFQVSPSIPGPVTLSTTVDYFINVTKVVASAKPTVLTLTFDNGERVVVNLQ